LLGGYRLRILNREEKLHFEELSTAGFKSDVQKNLHLHFFYSLAMQINLKAHVSNHLPASIWKAVRRSLCKIFSVLRFLKVDGCLVCKLTTYGWHSLLPEEEKIKPESTRQWNLMASIVMLNYV